jgi:hypothetical protein
MMTPAVLLASYGIRRLAWSRQEGGTRCSETRRVVRSDSAIQPVECGARPIGCDFAVIVWLVGRCHTFRASNAGSVAQRSRSGKMRAPSVTHTVPRPQLFAASVPLYPCEKQGTVSGLRSPPPLSTSGRRYRSSTAGTISRGTRGSVGARTFHGGEDASKESIRHSWCGAPPMLPGLPALCQRPGRGRARAASFTSLASRGHTRELRYQRRNTHLIDIHLRSHRMENSGRALRPSPGGGHPDRTLTAPRPPSWPWRPFAWPGTP